MPDIAILIRDRKKGGIVRVRTRGERGEPVRLRLCRSCLRVHRTPTSPCRAA